MSSTSRLPSASRLKLNMKVFGARFDGNDTAAAAASATHIGDSFEVLSKFVKPPCDNDEVSSDFDALLESLDMIIEMQENSVVGKLEKPKIVVETSSKLCCQGSDIMEAFHEDSELIIRFMRDILEKPSDYGHALSAFLSIIAFSFQKYVTFEKNRTHYLKLLDCMKYLLQHIKKFTKLILENMSEDSLPQLKSWIMNATSTTIKITMMIYKSQEQSKFTRYMRALVDSEDIKVFNTEMVKISQQLLLEYGNLNLTINKKTSSPIAPTKHVPVGLVDNVKHVIDCLQLGTNKKEVQCVCLIGKGGIGKTTLANYVYAEVIKDRKKKVLHHIISLPLQRNNVLEQQKRLLKALLQKTHIESIVGKSEVAKRFRNLGEPIFLVLDNLNTSSLDMEYFSSDMTNVRTSKEILQELIPEADCFPEGSAVLTTTREENTIEELEKMGFVVTKLEIPLLSKEDAKNTLYNYIGVDIDSVDGDIKKSWENPLLDVCGGFPLALQHVGGQIRWKEGFNDNKRWQKITTLMKEGRSLNEQEDVYSRLESSILGLDEEYKNAFLSTLMFYDGRKWDKVRHSIGPTLMDSLSSLFLVRQLNGCVNIHEVFKEIGRNILHSLGEDQRPIHYLVQWSQLAKEINNTEVYAICKKLEEKYKCMKHLKLQLPSRYAYEIPWIWLKKCASLIHIQIDIENEDYKDGDINELPYQNYEEFFKNLPNKLIRLGIVGWHSLATMQIQCCQQLETLTIKNCPNLNSLNLKAISKSIKSLTLKECIGLERLKLSKNMTNLQRLKLRGCHKLKSIKLPTLPSLKTLTLKDCSKLEIADLSSAISLNSLDLKCCTSLESLNLCEGSTSLQILKLSNCNTMKAIKNLQLPSLTYLSLFSCSNLEIAILTSASCLKYLDLRYCTSLETMELCSTMTSLRELELDGCKKMKAIKLPNLPSLKTLSIRGCRDLKVVDLSSTTSLKSLDLGYCEGLEGLELFHGMTTLQELRLDHFIKMKAINLLSLPSLTTLSLRGCRDLEIADLSSASSLKSLDISNCESLKTLELSQSMEKLHELRLDGCIKMRAIRLLSFPSLVTLILRGCRDLESVNLSNATSLKLVDLRHCESLEGLELPGLGMPSLHELMLDGCIKIKGIRLPYLPNLTILSLCGCRDLEMVDLSSTITTSLKVLDLCNCHSLEKLELYENMSNLEEFRLDGCIKMKSIKLPTLASLKTINLRGCRCLEIADFSSITCLESLELSKCESLETLELCPTMSKLQELMLEDCINMKVLMLPTLPSLTTLNLCGCRNLQAVALSTTTSIKSLHMRKCESLESLEICKDMTNLQDLRVYGCMKMKSLKLPPLPSLTTLSLTSCRDLEVGDLSSSLLTSLKFLEFKSCDSLKTLDLCQGMTNLEDLIVENCIKIKSINLPTLPSLMKLSLHGCRDLETIDILRATSLKFLDLRSCESLKILELSQAVENLQELILDGCIKIKSIEIPFLPSLTTLSLHDCKELESACLSGASSLASLDLKNCESLKHLVLSESMKTLQELILDGCNKIKSIKLSIVPSLATLRLCGCKDLESANLSSAMFLKSLDLRDCRSLESLELSKNMTNLQELLLGGCIKMKSIKLTTIPSLMTLGLSGCRDLEIVDLLGSTSLKSLDLANCESLKSLELFPGMTILESLILDSCIKMKSIKIPSLPSLTTVSLCGCRDLETANIMSSSSLKSLDLRHCESLKSLELCHGMVKLQELILDGCIKLRSIKLPYLPFLTTLSLRGCHKLESVDISSITSLKSLDLRYCESLQSLELSKSMVKLQKLILDGCIKMKGVKLPPLPSLTTFSLLGCKDSESVDQSSGVSINSLDLDDCDSHESLELW